MYVVGAKKQILVGSNYQTSDSRAGGWCNAAQSRCITAESIPTMFRAPAR